MSNDFFSDLAGFDGGSRRAPRLHGSGDAFAVGVWDLEFIQATQIIPDGGGKHLAVDFRVKAFRPSGEGARGGANSVVGGKVSCYFDVGALKKPDIKTAAAMMLATVRGAAYRKLTEDGMNPADALSTVEETITPDKLTAEEYLAACLTTDNPYRGAPLSVTTLLHETVKDREAKRGATFVKCEFTLPDLVARSFSKV